MVVKTATRKDWTAFRPLPVDDATRAFGAMGKELERLAPMYRGYKEADVPGEFTRNGGTMWNEVVGQWFFGGLKQGDQFAPKDDIDYVAAMRHVGAILRSFEPSHETKEAICAFLLSLWFADYTPDPSHKPHFIDRIESMKARTPPAGLRAPDGGTE